jgi:hypothetical protein
MATQVPPLILTLFAIPIAFSCLLLSYGTAGAATAVTTKRCEWARLFEKKWRLEKLEKPKTGAERQEGIRRHS